MTLLMSMMLKERWRRWPCRWPCHGQSPAAVHRPRCRDEVRHVNVGTVQSSPVCAGRHSTWQKWRHHKVRSPPLTSVVTLLHSCPLICHRGYSIIGSGSGFTVSLNPKWIRLTLDSLKSFDLRSESEPRFTVNPDLDPVIEYTHRETCHAPTGAWHYALLVCMPEKKKKNT